MPQLFQVLKCYKCSVFQAHQTKKSNKWQCKVCGEKQSIKRHYGLGTGKECRLHVQKLNGIRGEIDELSESITSNNSDEELENSSLNIEQNDSEERIASNKTKWSKFVNETELPKPEVNETMYLGNTEVVLEVPVRKRKKFNPPTSNVESMSILNYEAVEPLYNYNEPVYNYEQFEPVYKHIQPSNTNVSTSNYNAYFKSNSVPSPKVHVKLNSTTDMNNELGEVTNVIIVKPKRQDENHIEAKPYLPPKVNKNSKWAEFADEPDNNESISTEDSLDTFSSQENLVKNDLPSNASSENITKHLFSLCDENELDNVLEF